MTGEIKPRMGVAGVVGFGEIISFAPENDCVPVNHGEIKPLIRVFNFV